MKDLKTLYKLLEQYKDFDNDEENCEKFLDVVDQICLQKDASSIPILLKYLNDETDYSWVMESLIISLEIYSILDIIKFTIPYINNRNIYWISGVFYGIFNSPEDLEVFKQNIYLADQEELLKLFDYMEKESPHHYDLIQELRKLRLEDQ